MTQYVYLHSEHSADHDLFTVGFYKPDGKFEPESDHSTREEAAARVHYLNGGGSGRQECSNSLDRRKVK